MCGNISLHSGFFIPFFGFCIVFVIGILQTQFVLRLRIACLCFGDESGVLGVGSGGEQAKGEEQGFHIGVQIMFFYRDKRLLVVKNHYIKRLVWWFFIIVNGFCGGQVKKVFCFCLCSYFFLATRAVLVSLRELFQACLLGFTVFTPTYDAVSVLQGRDFRLAGGGGLTPTLRCCVHPNLRRTGRQVAG